MGNEINLKSSTIEKGIEIAKDFLDKLIMPAVEETGLLIKEKVTFWKFKNQVKVLNKAKEYCEKHGIEPKTISFKLLVPLLETSALEEDEILQDKWAILLSNMVDSEQNIENHVFPYILGQLSTNEFFVLEKVVNAKKVRIHIASRELEDFKANHSELKAELKAKIEVLKKESISKSKEKGGLYPRNEIRDLRKQKHKFEIDLENLQDREFSLSWALKKPEELPHNSLREFEMSNLIRLGLIKYVQENLGSYKSLKIPNNPNEDYLSIDFDIDVDYEETYLLTELGELFVDACTEKSKSSSI